MQTFEGQFRNAVNSIRQRALGTGMSVSELCRQSGVSRTAFDRWGSSIPNTITLVDKLETTVRKAEQKAIRAK